MPLCHVIIAIFASLPRNSGAMALTALLALALSSCESTSTKGKESAPEDAVARAYDQYLYKEDIRNLVSSETSKSDSTQVVNNFILSWVKQQVVLHKAEMNLDDEKKDVEEKLEEYRNSLITYVYETELIRQRLDTIVSDEEVEKYYNSHKQNFELKDNIIKVLYLKVRKDAPKLSKAREWYRSSTSKDRLRLEEYCYQYASDFHLDDDTWLLFDELLKRVPIRTYDKESFLRNNRFVETSDSSHVYLVNIKDMMIRDSMSPLSFVKDDIRVLIINKRKLSLIQEMEKAAYEEALKKNEFEIF